MTASDHPMTTPMTTCTDEESQTKIMLETDFQGYIQLKKAMG
jgi:hypothetical protein